MEHPVGYVAFCAHTPGRENHFRTPNNSNTNDNHLPPPLSISGDDDCMKDHRWIRCSKAAIFEFSYTYFWLSHVERSLRSYAVQHVTNDANAQTALGLYVVANCLSRTLRFPCL